jgi:hypothetical protein
MYLEASKTAWDAWRCLWYLLLLVGYGHRPDSPARIHKNHGSYIPKDSGVIFSGGPALKCVQKDSTEV